MSHRQVVEYKWVPLKTRNFEVLYYPAAQIEINHALDKRLWLHFGFLIDSGADITIMNMEDGADLGIKPETGERIELGTAGQDTIWARVHRLDMSFDGIIVPGVRIAFAEKNELKMSLLGRMDVFDYFDVNLHARAKRTAFVH